MPARSASCARSGAKGADRLSRTVAGSTTSTLATSASSPRRLEPAIVLCRSMLNFTAAASSFSPSWNVTPGRILSVSALLSPDHSYAVASCGTMFSFSSISKSLSHSAAKTIRPTKRARERWIQHVGILGQADAQGLRVRSRHQGRAENQCDRGALDAVSHTHSVPPWCVWRRAPGRDVGERSRSGTIGLSAGQYSTRHSARAWGNHPSPEVA